MTPILMSLTKEYGLVDALRLSTLVPAYLDALKAVGVYVTM